MYRTLTIKKFENEELKQIFDRYIAGTASPDEVRQLLNYFRLETEGKLLFELVFQEIEKHALIDPAVQEKHKVVYERLQQALNERIDVEQYGKVVPLWRRQFHRIAIAAMLLMAIGAGVWLTRPRKHALKPAIFCLPVVDPLTHKIKSPSTHIFVGAVVHFDKIV